MFLTQPVHPLLTTTYICELVNGEGGGGTIGSYDMLAASHVIEYHFFTEKEYVLWKIHVEDLFFFKIDVFTIRCIPVYSRHIGTYLFMISSWNLMLGLWI